MYEDERADATGEAEGVMVKVARVPGRVVDVIVPLGGTVADALRLAEIGYDGCAISVNGEAAGLDRVVNPMETLLVVNQHIKGAADSFWDDWDDEVRSSRTEAAATTTMTSAAAGTTGLTRRARRPPTMTGQTVLKGNDPERRREGVVFTVPVYQRIVELCVRSGHNEVGWFGTMDLTGGEVVIDDIFLPEQVVSTATVDITGLEGIAQGLIADGRIDDLGRLHFWGHCHPGTQAPMPSGMDEDTFDELSKNCPSCLMGIFSQDGRKAYFRLRHHGFDMRLGWRVVWPEQVNTFEDFDEKVSVRRFTPRRSRGLTTSSSRGTTSGLITGWGVRR